MAASRFRPPKSHIPPLCHQPAPGYGRHSVFMNDHSSGYAPVALHECEPEPVLRRSRTGICNLPHKAQTALRKERKADPKGTGAHSWRRRLWI